MSSRNFKSTTVRFDDKTEEFIKIEARKHKISVAEYIRQCITGERNELDKMTKTRIAAQVASLQNNLDAITQNFNARIDALNELLEEMRFRNYAMWYFFSRPRHDIEQTQNVVLEIERIAEHFMMQEKAAHNKDSD